MAPVTRSKKKEMETQVKPSSDSSPGLKRAAEEGENEKTGEKRRRHFEKETDMLEVEENKTKKTEESVEELNNAQEESSDNSHSETSFMDLPDDIHKRIFAFLDLRSRLKLRLNKRLDQLQLSVKNKMQRITLRIDRRRSHLNMDKYTPLRSSTLIQREKGLRLLALNTFVDTISLILEFQPTVEQSRILDALFHFNANKLIIRSVPSNSKYYLCHLTLPSFLTLAQNVRDVDIELKYASLSAKDLCIIRKTMLEGDCAMKSFKIRLISEGKKAFWEECFGVTISHCLGPVHGTMYHAADDSLQMYRVYDSWCQNVILTNCDGDLKTITDYYGICFKKLEVVTKPHDNFKIKWNHVYRGN